MLDIGSSDTGTGFHFVWNGPLIHNATSTIIEPISPGLFYLTVFNDVSGCVARDSLLLELPDSPSEAPSDIIAPMCTGDMSGIISVSEVTGGTPPYLYSLDGSTYQASPLFENLLAGDYHLTVVDANGCMYEENISMPDGQFLSLNIGADIDIQLGDSIQLSATVSLPWSQIDSIIWGPADMLSCTNCMNPQLHGLLNGIITAVIYAGSCVDQDQVTLSVDIDVAVYIPNVFSPNGDGKNDHITIYGDARVKKVVYLEIFDRWGNQVFVANNFLPNDPILGWDGTFRNKPLNPAVFAYIAKVELVNGMVVPFKGDITLMR
jgi:gliding motility-associated-like protein